METSSNSEFGSEDEDAEFALYAKLYFEPNEERLTEPNGNTNLNGFIYDKPTPNFAHGPSDMENVPDLGFEGSAKSTESTNDLGTKSLVSNVPLCSVALPAVHMQCNNVPLKVQPFGRRERNASICSVDSISGKIPLDSLYCSRLNLLEEEEEEEDCVEIPVPQSLRVNDLSKNRIPAVKRKKVVEAYDSSDDDSKCRILSNIGSKKKNAMKTIDVSTVVISSSDESVTEVVRPKKKQKVDTVNISDSSNESKSLLLQRKKSRIIVKDKKGIMKNNCIQSFKDNNTPTKERVVIESTNSDSDRFILGITSDSESEDDLNDVRCNGHLIMNYDNGDPSFAHFDNEAIHDEKGALKVTPIVSLDYTKRKPISNKVPLCSKWTPYMTTFYDSDESGDFDVEDVHNEQSAKKSYWKLDSSDYYVKKKNRYYNREPRCDRCRQLGHVVKNCPRVPHCYLCSATDHIGRLQCPQNCCFRCGGPWHSFCPATAGSAFCTVCLANGHSENACPDLWRRYHSTISGSTPIPPVLPANMEHQYKRYCSNCGRAGHYGYQCRMKFKNFRYIIQSQCVFSYGVPSSKKIGEIVNGRGNDSRIAVPNIESQYHFDPEKSAVLKMMMSKRDRGSLLNILKNRCNYYSNLERRLKELPIIVKKLKEAKQENLHKSKNSSSPKLRRLKNWLDLASSIVVGYLKRGKGQDFFNEIESYKVRITNMSNTNVSMEWLVNIAKIYDEIDNPQFCQLDYLLNLAEESLCTKDEQVQNQVSGKSTEEVQTQVIGETTEQVQNQLNGKSNEEVQTQVIGEITEQIQNQIAKQDVHTQVIGATTKQIQNQILKPNVHTQVIGEITEQIQNQITKQDVHTQVIGETTKQIKNQILKPNVHTQVIGETTEQIQNQITKQDVHTQVIGETTKQIKNQIAKQDVHTQVIGETTEQIKNQIAKDDVDGQDHYDPEKSSVFKMMMANSNRDSLLNILEDGCNYYNGFERRLKELPTIVQKLREAKRTNFNLSAKSSSPKLRRLKNQLDLMSSIVIGFLKLGKGKVFFNEIESHKIRITNMDDTNAPTEWLQNIARVYDKIDNPQFCQLDSLLKLAEDYLCTKAEQCKNQGNIIVKEVVVNGETVRENECNGLLLRDSKGNKLRDEKNVRESNLVLDAKRGINVNSRQKLFNMNLKLTKLVLKDTRKEQVLLLLGKKIQHFSQECEDLKLLPSSINVLLNYKKQLDQGDKDIPRHRNMKKALKLTSHILQGHFKYGAGKHLTEYYSQAVSSIESVGLTEKVPESILSSILKRFGKIESPGLNQLDKIVTMINVYEMQVKPIFREDIMKNKLHDSSTDINENKIGDNTKKGKTLEVKKKKDLACADQASLNNAKGEISGVLDLEEKKYIKKIGKEASTYKGNGVVDSVNATYVSESKKRKRKKLKEKVVENETAEERAMNITKQPRKLKGVEANYLETKKSLKKPKKNGISLDDKIQTTVKGAFDANKSGSDKIGERLCKKMERRKMLKEDDHSVLGNSVKSNEICEIRTDVNEDELKYRGSKKSKKENESLKASFVKAKKKRKNISKKANKSKKFEVVKKVPSTKQSKVEDLTRLRKSAKKLKNVKN